ncbi:hypothetical protein C8J56DRAFT_794386 [Mycena floridula]|nr:hypothetical protein C8J56DRAFT_794386 [Mycena floridula]
MTVGKSSGYSIWYESPPLTEGAHTLSAASLTSAEIDFMVVTPGPDTLLLDNFLLIDDSYPDIKYSGSWSTENPPGIPVPSVLFQSGSHNSNTNGDSLSFSFTGTNLAVYGMFASSAPLTLSAIIDGGAPTSQSANITSASLKLTPIYTTGSLSSGKHTVNLTVTQSIGQLLIIDFILYQPGFSTLSQMPDLSGSASSTSSRSPQPTSADRPVSTLSKKTPVGAIAGGVVGGILVLIAVLALLFFLRKRARRPNNQPVSHGQSLITPA